MQKQIKNVVAQRGTLWPGRVAFLRSLAINKLHRKRHARSVKKTFDAVQGDAMSVYNYVATAQKPTAVRFSLKGNFTRSDDVDLIVV